MTKIGDVCHVIMGQSPDSKDYNTEGLGLPLIQGNADIMDRKTKPRNYTTTTTKECEIGDLILTVRAPVGAVAKSVHKACIGRGVCALRVKNNHNSEFIYQFFVNHESKWITLEQGSTFTAVSVNEIKNLKIKLPFLHEQNIVAKFLSSFDLKLIAEQNILKHYHEQKKYLLAHLFI